MTDVFLGLFDTDIDPPTVENLVPVDGTIGFNPSLPIEFDIKDATAVDLTATQIYLDGVLAYNAGASQPGYTVTTVALVDGYHFSLSKSGGLAGYVSHTVLINTQDVVIPTNYLIGFTWSFVTADNTAPVVTNEVPLSGSSGALLTVSVEFDLTEPGGGGSGVDTTMTDISINRGGALQSVMIGGVQQTGYTVTVTPISGGFNYSVVPDTPFNYSEVETVTVIAQDIAGNTTGPVIWAFTTAQVPTYHARPYITNENPFDTATNVPLSSHIVFTVKTDDFTTPASSILTNETVALNGVVILSNGINIRPGQFDVVRTPSLRQVIIDILPYAGLAADTSYVLSGTFEDDVGNIGSDSFQFSTGSVEFAIQLDRTEPLLCPNDTIPYPLFATGPSTQTSAFSDLATSFTTDWANVGLAPYGAVDVADGPDVGRWLVRSIGATQVRTYHVFQESASSKVFTGYMRREFADRNPVILTFSPLFDYHLTKVWGDTRLRYLAGYPSDTRFPVAFHAVPIAFTHDFNDRLAGNASATNGSSTVTGVGTSFSVDLTPLNSYVRIGESGEPYRVMSAPNPTTITISPPFSSRTRMTGLVSITSGTNAVVGVGTNFNGEVVVGQKIQLTGDATYYAVAGISDATHLTIVGVAAQTSTGVTADVVSVVGQTIHKLDNSNGSTFDDQTNKRLDFSVSCNPAPTAVSAPVPRWDRYRLETARTIKPVITSTASLTEASQTVTMSGSAYRGELQNGAVVTFGTNAEYVVTDVSVTLPQITISPAWESNSVTGAIVRRKLAGTRSLTCFHLTAMEPLTEFFVGLNNSTFSPLGDGEDVMGVSFIRNVAGYVEMHGKLGTSVAIHDTGMIVGDFLNRDWILELELIEEHVMQVNVFSYDDLEVVRPNLTMTIENAGLPATSPTLSGWTVTTLASGVAAPNMRVRGYISYVDVEPGQGRPFSVGAGFVDGSVVKPRQARNRLNVPLAGQNGWRTLNVAAGLLASSFTGTQYDQIFWDLDEAIVVIDQFDVEGGASEVVHGPDRSVRKFSFNQGFDRITMRFRSSRRGFWYVIVDGKDPKTDLVAAQGVYDVANATQEVAIDGALFSGLGDGLHTLNVVICRDPVPMSPALMTGVATMRAIPNLLKASGASIFGIATITAIPTTDINEEDIMILEDLSAQVAGGSGSQTTFTTSVPYRTGKIKLILDGVIQNFNPIPGRVVETNNALGQISLSTPPRVNQKLVAEYVPL